MIELRKIGRSFQVGDETVHALADINLSIQAGEYISIMGPSGSGKSTLLNIIGLLDRPTQGQYLLDGIDTTQQTDQQLAAQRLHKMGFVFQFFHLITRLSAAANIELPMILAGLEPQQRKQRVQTVLQDLGLQDRALHRPDQLSGGQRQRVAIARATIMHPAILLADEPTGNLDQASGNDVIATLETLNQAGITLLVVTHDAELGKRAKRKLKMVDGRIVKDIIGDAN